MQTDTNTPIDTAPYADQLTQISISQATCEIENSAAARSAGLPELLAYDLLQDVQGSWYSIDLADRDQHPGARDVLYLLEAADEYCSVFVIAEGSDRVRLIQTDDADASPLDAATALAVLALDNAGESETLRDYDYRVSDVTDVRDLL